MSNFNPLASLAAPQSGCDQCLFFSPPSSLCVRYPPKWTGSGFSCPPVPVDFVCGEFQAMSAAPLKILASQLAPVSAGPISISTGPVV